MTKLTAFILIALLLALPAATTGFALDGVPFPGPAISQTIVKMSDDQCVIGNNTLTATFQRHGSTLRLAALRSPLNGLGLAWSDPNLFTIYLTGTTNPLTSSAMKLAGAPEEVVLVGTPRAAKLSQRLSGRGLQATFTDEASGLAVQWNASMTDGANYLRQEIKLHATHGPVNVDRIEMIHAQLPGAKSTGYTDGSPITTERIFLGLEHPMARNEARDAKVVCALPRQCALETGAVWTVSSGIGVYPAGQLRRAFLCYLERERAHPYRQYWHYNSWYDLNIGRNDNPDPLQRMTEAQCLAVIGAFGTELHDKRGVGLNGFVWDDGWDDWNSLWGFHKGFPNGFAMLKEQAAKQGAGMGAWLSPYWIFFADSIWRQGDDCSFRGKGSPREQWINYKDSIVYDRFASKSPLFPVNSLMYHGVLLGPTAGPGTMAPPAQDPDGLQHEMRMAAGYASGLGELYITPALMTPEAWDGLAECIRWARTKQAVMVDSHWVGGDPGKNEIYGFAAWHPQLGGVLTLRNPDDKPQTCMIQLATAFELPVAAETRYELRSPWKADAHQVPMKADANVPVQFTLKPFEVITLETQP